MSTRHNPQHDASTGRSRVVLFTILLILAAVAYFALFDLRLNLDKQEVMYGRGTEVWRAMRDNLPAVRYPQLMETVFVLAAVLIVVGSIAMIMIASQIRSVLPMGNEHTRFDE